MTEVFTVGIRALAALGLDHFVVVGGALAEGAAEAAARFTGEVLPALRP